MAAPLNWPPKVARSSPSRRPFSALRESTIRARSFHQVLVVERGMVRHDDHGVGSRGGILRRGGQVRASTRNPSSRRAPGDSRTSSTSRGLTAACLPELDMVVLDGSGRSGRRPAYRILASFQFPLMDCRQLRVIAISNTPRQGSIYLFGFRSREGSMITPPVDPHRFRLACPLKAVLCIKVDG